MVTRRHKAINNLRAELTIDCFAFLASALGSCPIPLGQCTVLLKEQKAPSQLKLIPRRTRASQLSQRVGRAPGSSSGVRNSSRRPAAFFSLRLKPRMPSRINAAFIRLTIRVCSPTRLSRSRLGRLASSSLVVGIATILQRSRSPRSQPRKARLSSSVSRRSVWRAGARATRLRSMRG